MRRLMVRLVRWIGCLLRSDPRVMRRMPAALLVIAAGLTGWVLELGAVLQGQAQVRNWSSTWVGLDLMEIAGLVLTAILLHRRSAYLSAAAAVTATLFGLDAWFDVLTATAGADWYQSLAAAFFGEIPMTVLLAALAVWAPRRYGGVRGGPHDDDPYSMPSSSDSARSAAVVTWSTARSMSAAPRWPPCRQ